MSSVAYVLIGGGVLFELFGAIGLVRLPDVYTRLQSATKCVTLGTCLILAGAAVGNPSAAFIVKAVLCAVFIMLTFPVGAHALARGSHLGGVKLWEKSVADAYTPAVEQIRAADALEAEEGDAEARGEGDASRD